MLRKSDSIVTYRYHERFGRNDVKIKTNKNTKDLWISSQSSCILKLFNIKKESFSQPAYIMTDLLNYLNNAWKGVNNIIF